MPGTKFLSPYHWVQENMDFFNTFRHKILIGIPYYGFKMLGS
jgi:hypothetical protein